MVHSRDEFFLILYFYWFKVLMFKNQLHGTIFPFKLGILKFKYNLFDDNIRKWYHQHAFSFLFEVGWMVLDWWCKIHICVTIFLLEHICVTIDLIWKLEITRMHNYYYLQNCLLCQNYGNKNKVYNFQIKFSLWSLFSKL